MLKEVEDNMCLRSGGVRGWNATQRKLQDTYAGTEVLCRKMHFHTTKVLGPMFWRR
jgi:hypothetical protein